MIPDKLRRLDGVLCEHHPALHATLQSGITAQSKFEMLRDWFAWKNGQSGGNAPFSGALFFGWHRFVPFEEGKHELQSARRSLWTNPIYAAFALTFGRQLLRSWPLLVDASGAGYYFDTGKRTVLYRVEGDPDICFDSFEDFVDFLIELSLTNCSERNFLETEQKNSESFFEAVVLVQISAMP